MGRGAGGRYRAVIVTAVDQTRIIGGITRCVYRALHSNVATDRASGHQKTVLLTLGRLPVALDLARGFAACGWRVIVADPFPMHLARMSNAVHGCYRVAAPAPHPRQFLDDIRALIAKESVDLVVPVSEETPHVASLLEEVGPATRLFAPSLDTVLRLHDKYDFIAWAQALDLPVPQTWRADDPEHRQISRDQPFVLKPRSACSGIGVRLRAAGSDVEARHDHVVQEWLEGRLLSSFSIARGGQTVLTSVYEATLLDGSVGVCFRRVDDAMAVEQWIATFVTATQHTGFIAFDFIVDEAGVARAIECNPRSTSGIHFLRSDTLPAAIAEDEPPTGDIYRPESSLTEAYSGLTVALRSLGSTEARSSWRRLREARDVTWRSDDPWPFLLMMVNTSRIVWLAATRRLSFAQAAVLDIRWNGAGDGDAA